MAKTTTIKINKETKKRLDHLKEHDRETYDQVIKKILYLLNRFRKDSTAGNRILRNIDANIKRTQAYLRQTGKPISELKKSPQQNPQHDKGSH